MFKFFKDIFDPSKKIIKEVQPTVQLINDLEPEFEKKSIDELKEVIEEIRNELKPLIEKIPAKNKSSLKSPGKDEAYVKKEQAIKDTLLKRLPEVYAAVREILKRKVGYSHYDVQFTASTILAQGYKLTELKTGEGKTLVFQLPAALYGLTGRGSHVVTVNDYLARRDAEYAGHILSPLGITVGVVTPQQSYKFIPDEDVVKIKGDDVKERFEKQVIKNPGDCDGLNLLNCTKTDAYSCDVVYGTNNEFGFDYLRDNMTMGMEDLVQKELYFCIVDESDSILIDEARTPLIISAPAGKSNDQYVQFAKLVPKLTKEVDYNVDEKTHSVTLTDEGAERMEKLLGVKNIWQDYKLAHHLENALKAMELYKRDDQYLVKNGEVQIVDEFTGRVLEGRRYSEGLHQAIEAKEGVEIKRESKTLGTITFQNFFRLYKILSGGSGTVMTEAEEFYKIYNLESVEVPTNKPVIRKDHNDRVYKNKKAKFDAVVSDVIELHKGGQPILIGTASIDDSEYVSKSLEMKGIEHEVLNAKQHERESKIVTNAGKKGAITVATNMAGRGTDIKLGGKNSTKESFNDVIEAGGLAVIGTQRHDSRRIDNQLRGRSGRQGEAGLSRFYVALDDDIMRIQGGDLVQKMMEMTNLPDDMPIEAGLIGRSIESAQKRMEGMHFDSRKTVVEYDDVVNQQREIFYSRRRRILREIEIAIKSKDENKEEKDGMKGLKEMLWTKLENEISSIVDLHFVEDRDDDNDKIKIIEDYLDLAIDQTIEKSISELEYKLEGNTTKEKLINAIKNEKSHDGIKKELAFIMKRVFETKMVEFSKDLPEICKVLVLRTMDELWTENLDAMKALRDGIGLRGFAQQDPLVEYKNEGFVIFDTFINGIDSQVSRRVLKVQKVVQTPQRTEEMRTNEEEVKDVSTGTRELDSTGGGLQKKANTPRRTERQKTVTKNMDIGRNDKVSVKYNDGTVLTDVKFKKVEKDFKSGKCQITSRG